MQVYMLWYACTCTTGTTTLFPNDPTAKLPIHSLIPISMQSLLNLGFCWSSTMPGRVITCGLSICIPRRNRIPQRFRELMWRIQAPKGASSAAHGASSKVVFRCLLGNGRKGSRKLN